MNFDGKVVIVTGAADGIGAVTAKALAKEGAKVALVDKNGTKLQEVAKKCAQYGNKPLIITADVTKDEDVRTIVKNTIDYFGKLDVLVNNAGTLRQSTVLDEKFMEFFDIVMKTDLRSTIYLTHLAAPYLIKTKGNIVNVSGIFGFRVLMESFMSHAVSKAGVNHFTRCVAMDLSRHGVRVNAVAPGATDTNILGNSGIPNGDEIMEEWRKEGTALKKLCEPEEITDIILFLASDKARSVTGSVYVADNGSLLM
ncbi:3-oxoacyl-[acyl-carrier-protein] reductase FabG-like [Cydia amplana]|uniref:3-oxoacyl-[acyl-carrier-protein] reductase FabG-like n=1 Tax=Cydia amplana TaxID=1869771 RepID=UPI002FE61087